MATSSKQALLVICLFVFLFVVLGGCLHLGPGRAFVASATGTPLVIHVFRRRQERREDENVSVRVLPRDSSTLRPSESLPSHASHAEPVGRE